MIKKTNLYRYFKNKKVIDLVFKVLDYNFKNEDKTKGFIRLLRQHLLFENNGIGEIKTYLKENNLELSKESERVDKKIIEINEIVKTEILNKPLNILDIGVGNGNILINTGKFLGIPTSSLFGIDVVDYSNGESFNHIKYNEKTIPLEFNSIDLILIMMVLHHAESPLSVLTEAHRVLKPNGSIIVRETNSYNDDLLEFNILMEYIFYTILLEIPINITDHYLNKEKWETLFKNAGFNYKKIKESELKNDPFTSIYYKLIK